MDVSNGSAIITGGGSGLGEACARRLAAAGARCVILDMNEETGTKVANELDGEFVKADVSNAEEVQVAVDTAVGLAPLRVLVNGAGIGAAGRTVDRKGDPFNLENFEFVLRVNLIGTFNCLRLAAAMMAKMEPLDDQGQRGAIVNMASVAAFDGQIGQCAYSASKGGVVGMTLPIARELARHGIRVVTIAPGLFDTPMLAGLPDEAKKSLGAQVPFPPRLGEPSEFAQLAKQIVENPMLNGDTIRLDGAIRMAPK